MNDSWSDSASDFFWIRKIGGYNFNFQIIYDGLKLSFFKWLHILNYSTSYIVGLAP